jgi:16S rRNA (uracil1498-N3)-methyltransferase
VEQVLAVPQWLQMQDAPADKEVRMVLQPGAQAALRQALSTALPRGGAVTLLSGPEGGLSDAESALAARHGFASCGLGPRILRADTAPLAALSVLSVLSAQEGPARA